MKKISALIVLILFVSIPSMVHSQGVGFGLKGGVNFANQAITNVTTESMTGYHAGGYFVIPFSEMWALQPEVLFSSQGSELPDINELNEFSYLTLPVLVRVKLLKFLSIEAGPQFSYLLDAKNKAGSIKDEMRKIDFGMAAGITLHSTIGLNGGVRYVWGFSNISDLEDNIEVKNKMFQVFVGWTLFGDRD
jgi:hypothetical protein